MCRESRCGEVDQLPQAERASEMAGRLDEKLASLEEQLFALAAGASIEVLLTEAQTVSADELPGRIEQIAQRIEQLDRQRGELQQSVGREENELARMQTDGGAADAAEEVQELLARLEGDVLHYVRLRLASAILREGIESYRAKNEGPVRRASELFQQFTLGRFERLMVEGNGDGQNVLKGVRADTAAALPGEPKTVELQGMSEGTADQLFLACGWPVWNVVSTCGSRFRWWSTTS